MGVVGWPQGPLCPHTPCRCSGSNSTEIPWSRWPDPSFQGHLPAPPSLRLLGLLGSLLAELSEGLSLFVPFPGLQQLQDLICQRRGE